MIITEELGFHIQDKISYHKRMEEKYKNEEKYLLCAKHRDEIKRLEGMLTSL